MLEINPPRAWLVLFLFALALQIFSIWNLELSERDSPRVAGIAREMAITSNYLIPRLNGENFLEYPPLGYWPMALTLSVSQKPTDFLAFIPIVFFGAGTVLITYLIGKRLAGERIGLMAGFILATMPSFITYHRHCRVDPVLLFFITLSLYGFAAVYQTSKKSFPFFAIFYLAMAGAFLSKGIIGVAIPAATAVVFLITRKDLTAIRKLILSPGILLFLLPIFLWVGSVWWLEGPGIFKEVIRQSLQRFLSPSADHAKPFYFYFIPAFLTSHALDPSIRHFIVVPMETYPFKRTTHPWLSSRICPCLVLDGFHRTLPGLSKAAPLPRTDLPSLCTSGSPWMEQYSREIP